MFPRRRPVLIAVLGLTTLLTSGCVRRRMMIRSNPPGATVFVDNQLVGTTPCATDFVYYGTREVRLVKPGFETLTVSQPIPAPWYEIPPLDFVSEVVMPRKIQDFRTLSYNLTPQVIVPTEQLLERAEELRSGTGQGLTLPPATVPGPGGSSPILPPLSVGGSPELLPPQSNPPGLMPGQAVPAPAGGLSPGGQPLEPLR